MTSKHVNKRSVILVIALAACVLLGRTPRMQAQQLATLSVTVTDPSNRVVPGAQVTLTSAQTSLIRTQAADRAGLAVLSALTPGDYRLDVKAEGFSEYQQPLTLTVGQVASVARPTWRRRSEADHLGIRIRSHGRRHGKSGIQPGHPSHPDSRPSHCRP